MKINPINYNNFVINNNLGLKSGNKSLDGQKYVSSPKDSVSFQGLSTFLTEMKIKNKYNIQSNFRSNTLVAESTEKVIKIFNDIFGKKLLPSKVEFKSFNKLFGYNSGTEDASGVFIPPEDKSQGEVYFNADLPCYKSKDKLKFEELINKIVWWSPTSSYLQTFVHEFGHAAHYNNLERNHCPEIMMKLAETRIPSSFGRFVTKCKLGRYSATNMAEFMAERITKDICKNLNDKDEFVGDVKDLKYSDIFYRKWKYRYATPQSYLDYFTQQVWNGNVEGAKVQLYHMEQYLAELEAVPVPVSITKAAESTVVKNTPILESIFSGLIDFFTSATEKADERNRIKLNG